MSHWPRAKPLLAVLFTLVVAACSSSADGVPVRNAQGTNYQAAVCGAILSLADNRSDFSVFLNGDSPDAAIAALHRVRDRTASAADRLKAAATWPPGREAATRLAATQRDLLPILANLEAATTQADTSQWTAATHAYTDWYNSTFSVLQAVEPMLTSLGVACT